jgi:hypothetical protein
MPVRQVFGLRGARCTGARRGRRGLERLPFGSGDSRKRWPGPGQDVSPVNPQWSAEGRAALVMRVAAVPGNGCSSHDCAWQSPGAPIGAPLPSLFGGSKKLRLACVRGELSYRLNKNSVAHASRERFHLSAPAIAGRDEEGASQECEPFSLFPAQTRHHIAQGRYSFCLIEAIELPEFDSDTASVCCLCRRGM